MDLIVLMIPSRGGVYKEGQTTKEKGSTVMPYARVSNPYPTFRVKYEIMAGLKFVK
jgi:hypothetical protein